MALSHDLMRERSLSLVAEVREHLLQLTRDAPGEAALFRRQLAELIYDGQESAATEAANGAALRRIQLYALRSWEEERSRLGERLRLGTAQLLANAAVELAASLPLLATDPDIVEQGLRSLEQELRAGLETLREILSGLESPQLMKELGLIGALEVYAQRLARQHAIQVITQFAARPPRLPPTIEIAIYRVVQEALRNAIEHGKATTIIVASERADGRWRFAVLDNGSGFDPEQLSSARGLVAMHEWVEAIGGRLDVCSQPGQGASVAITIDLSEIADERASA